MNMMRGSSQYHTIQNLLFINLLLALNVLSSITKKGEIVSAFSPFCGFWCLNDNIIKGLTSLLRVEHETKYIEYT
jgi:hypothetical protein